MSAGEDAAAGRLLAEAVAILDGARGIPASQVTRAAAFVARQAVEDRMRQLCSDAGVEIPRANGRSRLIVLRELVDADVAEAAHTAWSGLSRYCHRHAFELSPTTDEVRHLIRRARLLVEPSRGPDDRPG
ncbi:hypothetical protein GCM10009676_15540 [Prauserella halophila]|uniref:Uncharacterized protein n=1 Tax=Prauserella halophila TaxID=185641 RepID=A0ABN1W314_9PSEU|nr:hypothetical protein [Prauserella halophila]MCP2236239.1 hypothetical protein [Prauserella halophila]